MLLGVCASNRTDRGAIRPCNGLNTPLFCHSRMAKILEIDRSIRLSNFPPKSQRKGITFPLQLSFPACKDIVDSCIQKGDIIGKSRIKKKETQMVYNTFIKMLCIYKAVNQYRKNEDCDNISAKIVCVYRIVQKKCRLCYNISVKMIHIYGAVQKRRL